MNSVKKPIFLIGAGRSGSTALHQVLCGHPHASWLSSLLEKYPQRLDYNRYLLQAIDYPVIGTWLKDIVRPGECYAFWENNAKGFRHPFRDLVQGDLTDRTRRAIQSAMGQFITEQRQRLIIKITGWPRIGYLQEIFPDAKFIHVVRDGRAVANSLLNVNWWWGWRGPENWRWGPLSPTHAELWKRYNYSFVALAGIQWNIIMEAVANSQHSVDSANFITFKYEDICESVVDTLQHITEFCELEWTSEYKQLITKAEFENQNSKWKTELTQEQQFIIEMTTQNYLQKYGYL